MVCVLHLLLQCEYRKADCCIMQYRVFRVQQKSPVVFLIIAMVGDLLHMVGDLLHMVGDLLHTVGGYFG